MTIINLKKNRNHAKHPEIDLHLDTPLTIITGPNGYGKSTLLNSIQHSLEAQYKNALKLEPTSNPYEINYRFSKKKSYFTETPDSVIITFDAHSIHDYHSMIGSAMVSGHMHIDRHKYSEGQARIIDLNRVFEIANHIKSIDNNIPIFILLDAVDSGLSPDIVEYLVEIIFKQIQRDVDNTKIIMTTNTFEFVNELPSTTILDAKSCLKIAPFSDYKDYVNYCKLNSSVDSRIKDACVYRKLELPDEEK